MINIRHAAAFISLLALIACGKKEVPEGMTRVIFKTGNDKSIQSYSINKGLLVYGMNIDQGKSAAGAGANIGNFISTNSEVILPNGRYKFFATGYDDNGTPANDAFHSSSKVFCAEGNGGQEVNLTGGIVSVSITLVDGGYGQNCTQEFAGSEFRTNTPTTNSFKTLKVNFCSNGVNNTGCASSAWNYSVSSALIKVPAYDKIKNNMDFDFSKSISGCMTVSSGVLTIGTKIPYRMPFHFQVTGFQGGSCTGTIMRIADFPNGVEGVPNAYPDMGIINAGQYVDIFVYTP